MSNEITHTTLKNDKKEVTGYEIKIGGVLVGLATKGEKGKFNFKAHAGAGKDSADHKTMRDLKVQVSKDADRTFVQKGVEAINAAAPKAKETKPAAPKDKPAAPKDKPAAPKDKPVAETAKPAEPTAEDIDLD